MGLHRHRCFPLFVLLLLLLAPASTFAAAKDRTAGGHPYRGQALQPGTQFTPAERHLIRAFYAAQERRQAASGQRLPPGLEKNLQRGKPLPPGWQKKVVPGRSLDYRIYRQGTPLPATLLNRLANIPSGFETIRVAGHIIRLHAATRKIIDSFSLDSSN